LLPLRLLFLDSPRSGFWITALPCWIPRILPRLPASCYRYCLPTVDLLRHSILLRCGYCWFAAHTRSRSLIHCVRLNTFGYTLPDCPLPTVVLPDVRLFYLPRSRYAFVVRLSPHLFLPLYRVAFALRVVTAYPFCLVWTFMLRLLRAVVDVDHSTALPRSITYRVPDATVLRYLPPRSAVTRVPCLPLF